jgi:hypothetical protein
MCIYTYEMNDQQIPPVSAPSSSASAWKDISVQLNTWCFLSATAATAIATTTMDELLQTVWISYLQTRSTNDREDVIREICSSDTVLRTVASFRPSNGSKNVVNDTAFDGNHRGSLDAMMDANHESQKGILDTIELWKKRATNEETLPQITSSRMTTMNEPNTNSCSTTFLRKQIQLQIALRLSLWVWAGPLFPHIYNTCCTKHKLPSKAKKHKKGNPTKKRKLLAHHTSVATTTSASPENHLLLDTIGFLQLIALQLPPEKSLIQFIRNECGITKQQMQMLGSQLQPLWDSFEIRNPLDGDLTRPTGSTADYVTVPYGIDDVHTTKQSRQPKRRSNGDGASKSSSVHQSSSATNQKSSSCNNTNKMKKNNVGIQRSLLPIKTSNISLTTATAQFNPLLKDKAHFVGSHFNTQLSNISNLFRQVSVPMVTKKSNTTTMSKTNRTTQATSKTKANLQQDLLTLPINNKNGAHGIQKREVHSHHACLVPPPRIGTKLIPSDHHLHSIPVMDQENVLPMSCVQNTTERNTMMTIHRGNSNTAISSNRQGMNDSIRSSCPIHTRNLVAEAMQSLQQRQERRRRHTELSSSQQLLSHR